MPGGVPRKCVELPSHRGRSEGPSGGIAGNDEPSEERLASYRAAVELVKNQECVAAAPDGTGASRGLSANPQRLSGTGDTTYRAHILEHPEMAGLEGALEETLSAPQQVIHSLSDPQVRLYTPGQRWVTSTCAWWSRW